jgi:hypothetical protein
MDITSGAVSPRVNRGEPQSEQKLRVASLPLVARTECVFGVPVIVISDTVTADKSQFSATVAPGDTAPNYQVTFTITDPSGVAVYAGRMPRHSSLPPGCFLN